MSWQQGKVDCWHGMLKRPSMIYPSTKEKVYAEQTIWKWLSDLSDV